MKKEDHIKYLEREFLEYYNLVREASGYLYDMLYGFDRLNNERAHSAEKSYAEYWTYEYLYRMYNILCVYFQVRNLTDYLQEFKHQFEPIIKNKTEAIKITFTPLEHGDSEEELELLAEWKKYLAPFTFFQNVTEEKETRKIIDFLECTNEILKVTKTEVSIEEDINSIMRETAKFYFSNVTAFSEGFFVHQFKHYKPDIIFKGLKTAVEYKLIRKEKDIGIKLDELLIDAKRYLGNENNKFCIAVFCLSDKVHKTKKEIKEEWKRMKFSKNWELVIISDIHLAGKTKQII